VTGSWDKTARLWDAETGRPLGEPFRHRGVVRSVAFSPDGKTILTLDEGGARLWDATTREYRELAGPGQDQVRTAILRPEGWILLMGGEDGTARLFDIGKGRPVGKPTLHRGPVGFMAVSPDGQLVLTGSSDGIARLWDFDTGVPIGDDIRHLSAVTAATFSPDGKTLLTGSEDGTARLWAVPAPVEGTPEQVSAWVEVLSGMRLDPETRVQELDEPAWRQRRLDLERLRGTLSP
jgi:WD40 repeat protein